MPNFKFRLPAIGDLTHTQQIAYYENRSVLVTGGPGSGKTVVSIYRFLKRLTETKEVIFFTYHRTLVASIKGTFIENADLLLPNFSAKEIESYLEDSVGSISEWYFNEFRSKLSQDNNEEINSNISNFLKKKHGLFEEIFIDEAQDLKPILMESILMLSPRFTFGADRAQDLQKNYLRPADEHLLDLLKNHNINFMSQGLTRNFRNTREIFSFAREFVKEDIAVQQIDISQLSEGEKPEVFLKNIDDQLKLILQIIIENPKSNIGIMVHFKDQVYQIKNFLETNNFSCSSDATEDRSFSYYHYTMDKDERDVIEKNLRTPFILTFESCKGLEFDIVILPMFDVADIAMNLYKKTGSNQPDLDAGGNYKYFGTPNHYYVACTRARSLLYIMFEKKPKILEFYNE